MTLTTYVVVAQVEPGELWRNVLTTADLAYAQATKDQFVEAGVPVRVDVVHRKPKSKQRRPRSL